MQVNYIKAQRVKLSVLLRVSESICVKADQRVLLRCALLTSRTDFISLNGGDQMDAKGMKTKREGFGTNIYLQLKRKNHHF